MGAEEELPLEEHGHDEIQHVLGQRGQRVLDIVGTERLLSAAEAATWPSAAQSRVVIFLMFIHRSLWVRSTPLSFGQGPADLPAFPAARPSYQQLLRSKIGTTLSSPGNLRMTGWIIALIVIGGVLLLLVFWMVSMYNGLVVGRNQYKNAYAQVDVQLKRRYDLIPNLVEAVKGKMAHEKGTLDAVIQAPTRLTRRAGSASRPGDPDAMKALGSAEGQLDGALYKTLRPGRGLSRIFRATRTCSASRKSSPSRPKTRSATPGKRTTTQAWAWTTSHEVFPAGTLSASVMGFTAAKSFEIDTPSRPRGGAVPFSCVRPCFFEGPAHGNEFLSAASVRSQPDRVPPFYLLGLSVLAIVALVWACV